MNNNKNNSANIAEESNNKTMLYGGIGIVVLVLLIGFCIYMWGGSGDSQGQKSEDAVTVIATCKQLSANKFVTEELKKDIETHKKKTEDSDSKKKEDSSKALREKYLRGKEPKAIQEAYTKEAENIKNCQQKMMSMMSAIAIIDLEITLKKLEENNISKKLEGEKRKKVKANIKQALEKLEEAKKAGTNKKRKEALEALREKLNECVKDTSLLPSFLTSPERLISDNDSNFELVNKEIEKIDNILPTIPESGNVQKYDSKSLQEALNTWNEKYQTIRNQYAVVEALGLNTKVA